MMNHGYPNRIITYYLFFIDGSDTVFPYKVLNARTFIGYSDTFFIFLYIIHITYEHSFLQPRLSEPNNDLFVILHLKLWNITSSQSTKPKNLYGL